MVECPAFRPDHNGECLNCDEWADAHTPAALAQADLVIMARDWMDRAVVVDAPERVPHVIAQLVAEIERLNALSCVPREDDSTCPRCGARIG